MSNSNVFGSPMILTGNRPASPFGAACSAQSDAAAGIPVGGRLMRVLRTLIAGPDRDRRIHKTVTALSRLDDRTLRDIGLSRGDILSAARQATDSRYGKDHFRM